MLSTTMLPLETSFGDFKTCFNAAAVRYDGGLVVIDVGLPGFLPKLEEALEKEGLKAADIRKVIITHCDGDHAGALKALLDKYPEIEVISSARQAAYITGREKHPRLQAFEKRFEAAATEEEKGAIAKEMAQIKALEHIQRVTDVRDGQELDNCGIKIIEVPGHMPGHICVYIPKDKALITGDALTSADGKLCPPSSVFTLDMPTALRSLEKLLEYDIEHVICYHGGHVSGNIRESLLEIIGG